MSSNDQQIMQELESLLSFGSESSCIVGSSECGNGWLLTALEDTLI